MTTFALAPYWSVLYIVCVVGIAAVWIMGLSLLVGGQKYYRRLSETGLTARDLATVPSLSVLVPACNEGRTIERAMNSLLDLDYPDLEIIAIDDRSTDDTGAILERLAAEYPRLRVRHITELPPGWLGKNHALQVAGEQARGEWLLFTDADVIFEPKTLCRAVAYAAREGLDHLVLAPKCETVGFWEKLFVSYFTLMFSFRVRPWDVAGPRKSAYVGLGSFNLVRASAYRSFGGHTALPMDVTDDMKLGKVIKRNGFRQDLLDGSDQISVRWVVGLRGVLDSLVKNAFAGFDFKLPFAIAGMAGMALLTLLPAVALLVSTGVVRIVSAMTLGVMVLGAGFVRRLTGASPVYGLAYPLACLIFIWIILRSILRAYLLDGVVWRGTLYPLGDLRKGIV